MKDLAQEQVDKICRDQRESRCCRCFPVRTARNLIESTGVKRGPALYVGFERRHVARYHYRAEMRSASFARRCGVASMSCSAEAMSD